MDSGIRICAESPPPLRRGDRNLGGTFSSAEAFLAALHSARDARTCGAREGKGAEGGRGALGGKSAGAPRWPMVTANWPLAEVARTNGCVVCVLARCLAMGASAAD
eukprot:362054-Chlamydomonas_euryale.AAC.2